MVMAKLTRDRWIILEVLAPIIVKGTNCDCVVDIGMGFQAEGYLTTTEILAAVAKEFDIDQYSCDIEVRFGPLHDKHILFEGDSLDFLKQFPEDKHPGVVMIDGSHHFDHTDKEVTFFLKQMCVNGILFAHDWYLSSEDLRNHPSVDDYKVRQRLEKENKVDIFTFPYTASEQGLTIVRRCPEGLPPQRRRG